MKVRELMSRTVQSARPNDSLAEAAALMAEGDFGAVPVVEDDRVVGILTDRDIAVRGLAARLRSSAAVKRIMTRRISTCSPDDEVDSVLEAMGHQQIRRLPVCEAGGKLVGMFSLGDAAQTEDYQEAAALALSNVSRPHGRHCQHHSAA